MNLATRAGRRHKEIASFSVARRNRPTDVFMRKWYGLRVARHTGMSSCGIGRAHSDLFLRTPSRNINTFAIRYYSELLMERSCPLDLIVPKRTRRGIPSKRRPFSCIHAINTNPPLPRSPPYNTFFFTERKSLFTSLLPSHLSLYSHLFTHWK